MLWRSVFVIMGGLGAKLFFQALGEQNGIFAPPRKLLVGRTKTMDLFLHVWSKTNNIFWGLIATVRLLRGVAVQEFALGVIPLHSLIAIPEHK